MDIMRSVIMKNAWQGKTHSQQEYCGRKFFSTLSGWSYEKYGMISPLEFIPLLEKSGLILPVRK